MTNKQYDTTQDLRITGSLLPINLAGLDDKELLKEANNRIQFLQEQYNSARNVIERLCKKQTSSSIKIEVVKSADGQLHILVV